MGTSDLLARFVERLDRVEDLSDPVLLAFSGGLDSSVLLDLAWRHQSAGGPQLHLVHIDHGLRPSSADDASFCQRRAEELKLPLEVVRLDLGSPPVDQGTARAARLQAIARIADEQGIGDIYTGHHGDDRIESFFFHLLRGTGLDGLAPMPLSSPFPLPGSPLRMIRPLQGELRADLETYAEEQAIPFVEDPTNASDDYSRNAIRHHLIPEVAPESRSREILLRAMDNLDDERRAADHFAEKLLREARAPWSIDGEVAMEREPLAAAPHATVTRLLRRLQPGLTAEALRRAADAIAAPSGACRHLDLPGCLLTVGTSTVVLQPSSARGGRDVLTRQASPVVLKPSSAGQATFEGFTIRWSTIDETSTTPNDDPWVASFDRGSLCAPITVHGWSPGMKLLRRSPNGEIYHQSLTKLFAERGIDAWMRWRWPCLTNGGDDLLWAGGLPRGARAEPAKNAPRWRCRIVPPEEFHGNIHL